MAKRRMFSLDIIDTDIFLEMPQTSRLLYYELCMRADDDGFVSSPKKIMRTVGCNEDDFKILIAKQFLIPFENGVVVIRHWKIHNYIRNDRYTETIYLEEKKQLIQEENGTYKEVGIPNDNQVVYQMDTQVRLGKGSIDKDIDMVKEAENWEQQFEKFYSEYPKKVKKQEVKKWFKKNKPSSELFSSMMSSLERFRGSKDWLKDNGQYIPYPSTWLNQKRWEDEDDKSNAEEKQKQAKEYKVNTLTEAEYFKNGGGKRYV